MSMESASELRKAQLDSYEKELKEARRYKKISAAIHVVGLLATGILGTIVMMQ